MENYTEVKKEFERFLALYFPAPVSFEKEHHESVQRIKIKINMYERMSSVLRKIIDEYDSRMTALDLAAFTLEEYLHKQEIE